jgi:hypothetical protein
MLSIRPHLASPLRFARSSVVAHRAGGIAMTIRCVPDRAKSEVAITIAPIGGMTLPPAASARRSSLSSGSCAGTASGMFVAHGNRPGAGRCCGLGVGHSPPFTGDGGVSGAIGGDKAPLRRPVWEAPERAQEGSPTPSDSPARFLRGPSSTWWWINPATTPIDLVRGFRVDPRPFRSASGLPCPARGERGRQVPRRPA